METAESIKTEYEPFLISVIVPVYNAEKYLRKSIESIINQTHKNLEIILINDGSTDESGKICDEYAQKDSRIKVVHKSNGGVSSARNVGLDAANGEYVLFVDSDDYVALNTCERVAEAALRNNAEVVVFNYECIDLEGNILKKLDRPYMRPLPTEETVWDNSEFCKRVIWSDSEVCGFVWNKFVRRPFIGELRFDESLTICEDLMFTHTLSVNKGRFVYIPDELYHHVCHPYSLTGTVALVYDEIIIADKVLASVCKHFPVLEDEALADFINRYTSVMGTVYIDKAASKTVRKIGKKWWGKIRKCPKIQFKIKLVYCIINMCPRLFFRILIHL